MKVASVELMERESLFWQSSGHPWFVNSNRSTAWPLMKNQTALDSRFYAPIAVVCRELRRKVARQATTSGNACACDLAPDQQATRTAHAHGHHVGFQLDNPNA